MAPLSRPLPYRLAWLLTPPSFRDRHTASIDAQLVLDLRAHVDAGGRRTTFWLRACTELARNLPSLWLAALRRSRQPLIPRTRGPRLDDLLQDLRYAARGLYARPAMTLLCVTAIALGIGANATVFTIASDVFLRPVPVHEPSRLVDLHVEQPGANSFVGFSYPELLDLRRASGLEGISASSGTRMELGQDTGTMVSGQFASANHLTLLGVEVAAGRLYTAEEDVPGGPLVAVVSHAFWQDRLGRPSDAIGTTIELGGQAVTIVGILAPPFAGRFIGFPTEFWLPLHARESMQPGSRLDDREAQNLELVARLTPEATAVSVTAALTVVATALEEAFPDSNRDRRVSVTPFTGMDASLRAGVMGFLGVLGTLAGLVLAAACLNVGNLLLARGQARAPEFATRLALGGSRLRIVRQVMTETVLLFALGLLAATALSLQLTGLMRTMIGAMPIPLGLPLRVDWQVLAITGVVALLTALATGAQPAIRAAGAPPADALRSARSGQASDRRLNGLFVGAQVAVSALLLVTAALFLRALTGAAAQDPGFEADGLQIASVALDPEIHAAPEATRLLESLAAETRALSGVEAVGLGSTTPVGVARTPVPVDVPGQAPPAGQDAFFADLHVVDDQYLRATGIPLARGRGFAPGDDADGNPVGLVNRTMESRIWPGAGALGEQIVVRGQGITIVGVVADTRHLVQDADFGPLLYLPLAQQPRTAMNLVVRSALAPADLERWIDAAADRLTPAARVGSLRPQRALLDSFLLPQKIAARVAAGLGAVALLLSLTGIYGMVAFAVTARRREMGIRMALGADPSGAVRLLVRSALLLVGTGAVVGAAASVVLGSAVGAFLLGGSPFDPVALGAVVAGLLLVAAAAAWLPARRAAAIDPAIALRSD